MGDLNAITVAGLVILLENVTTAAIVLTNVSVVGGKGIWLEIVLRGTARPICNVINVTRWVILHMNAQVTIVEFSMILWVNTLKNIDFIKDKQYIIFFGMNQGEIEL